MKYIVGVVIFVAIMVFGKYVLGIEPSFAEILLVAMAAAIADVVEEML